MSQAAELTIINNVAISAAGIIFCVLTQEEVVAAVKPGQVKGTNCHFICAMIENRKYVGSVLNYRQQDIRVF